MNYDRNNIFAKILRAELPCKKVHEDDNILAFHDIAPDAPVHVIVVPKDEYISFDDFIQSSDTVSEFFQAVRKIAHQLGLEKNGYRIVTNNGVDAGQIVPHFHVHVLGGGELGSIA